jgi:hypothetical protein
MYKYKKISVRGRKIDEHRYVMEQHLGRYLQRNEIIRHINGDVRDNRVENLTLMHKKMQPYTQMAEGTHYSPNLLDAKKGRDGMLKKYGKKIMIMDALDNEIMIVSSLLICAKVCGCSRGNISDVISGRKKQSHNLKFKHW